MPRDGDGQLTFDLRDGDGPDGDRPRRRKLTKAERFAEFDLRNPAAWELFQRFAFEAIRAGRRRLSADMILHRLRWHTSIETRGDDPWKLNNDWAAFYARKFIAKYPEHAEFFETRKQRTH